MTEFLNQFEFVITNPFSVVMEELPSEQYDLLDEPSGLTKVMLLSDWWKQTHRLVDFTGTTNKEAIQKILYFYQHKGHRRGVGDHIFFEGFDTISRCDNVMTEHMMIQLGS